MKTKILKKINDRIRITSKNDSFVVEHRSLGSEGWQFLNSFPTFKAALNKKHSYIVIILLRNLGYRNEFVKRRTKRKDKK